MSSSRRVAPAVLAGGARPADPECPGATSTALGLSAPPGAARDAKEPLDLVGIIEWRGHTPLVDLERRRRSRELAELDRELDLVFGH